MISNKRLQRLSNCLVETKGVSETLRRDALTGMKASLERWEADQASCAALATLFQDNAAHIPEALSDILMQWINSGKTPSLLSLLGFVAEVMEIDETYPLMDLASICAILGDTQTRDLAFHNHDHVMHVTLTASVLGFHHNRMHRDSPLELSDFLALFSAACIHDLGHDGQGNYAHDGRHMPSRLEIQSVEMAEPFMRTACQDEGVIQRIGMMIVATDVSESDGVVSPSNLLKLIMMARITGSALPVVPMYLNDFATDARLGLMALLLAEADVIPSMAMSYDMSRDRTVRIAKESQKLLPNAQTLCGFVDKICDGLLMSEVAKTIFEDSFRAIHQRAKKDQANDVSYAA